jgi:ATP adenylyltransferase
MRRANAVGTCQLCSPDRAQVWNVPLIESSNFVILPSLGALVEGWLLLLPKEHFLSLGALPSSLIQEMQGLKQNVCERMERAYGAACVFEHGPGKRHRSVGCGVDHAHLHIVPTNFDLALFATPFLPIDARWHDASFFDCRAAAEAGDDYLYFEQPIGEGRLIRNQHLGSQVFRRAIAAYLEIPDQFNWRDNPQIKNVDLTIRVFTRKIERESPGSTMLETNV